MTHLIWTPVAPNRWEVELVPPDVRVTTRVNGRLLAADPHTTTDENDPPEDAEEYRDTEPVEEDEDDGA